MGEKRKISARKVLQFIVTILVVTGCVVAVTSASRKQEQSKVKAVDIRIRNEKQCRFVDREEVRQMLLSRRHMDVTTMPVGEVNVHQMESIAKSNPWISNAEVFIDNAAVLHINITQRVPVVRVFEGDGSSYYLDSARKQLPLSLRYVHYVPVVTGVPRMKNDSASESLKGQILAISNFIERDTFWRAQVEEVHMNPDRNFELVPVLGKHRIVIGDTSRLSEKFSNLFAFYRKVLNRIGWDKYEVLDLRFSKQVVASPSLPWKAPVDRALSNMNWVKSIVGDEEKENNAAAIARPVGVAAASATVPAPAAAPKPAAAPVKKESVVNNNNAPVKPAPKKVAPTPAKAATPAARPQAKPVVKKDPPRPPAKKKTETAPAARKAAARPDKTDKDRKKAQEPPRKPKYLYQDNQ